MISTPVPPDSVLAVTRQHIERIITLNTTAWNSRYVNTDMARHLAGEAHRLSQLPAAPDGQRTLPPYKSGIAWSLLVLSHCDMLQFNTIPALQSAREALQLFEELNDGKGQVLAHTVIGLIYNRMSDSTSALKHLHTARHLTEKLALRPQWCDVQKALSETYEMTGDSAAALRHYKLFYNADRTLPIAADRQAEEIANLLSLLEQTKKNESSYRKRIEQLEAEMHRKNQELAEMALNLVRKQELLDEFIKEVSAIIQTPADNKEQKLNNLKRELLSNINTDLDWTLFQKQFVKVHPQFIASLATNHPTLTPTELKVCCLLKIGLSSKEIMQLMRVTIRVVEAHRYNIRRKIRLSTKQNLITFLSRM